MADMGRKIRVGVLFGGRSCEHEVSVTSARSLLEALDKERYEAVMIGITKEGGWVVAEDALKVLEAGVVEDGDALPVMLDYPGTRELVVRSDQDMVSAASGQVDVIFPILHGPFGEDGTVQGLLELAGVAYVGAGVVGSAVGMDKEMMRRAFRAEGLPQVEYMVARRRRWETEPESVLGEIEERFAYPVFVKPVNLGSSVGITKARDAAELRRGMDEAASFDYKIMVEAAAENCREVECAVLGNEDPRHPFWERLFPATSFTTTTPSTQTTTLP